MYAVLVSHKPITCTAVPELLPARAVLGRGLFLAWNFLCAGDLKSSKKMNKPGTSTSSKEIMIRFVMRRKNTLVLLEC